jgi:hypothetical protein
LLSVIINVRFFSMDFSATWTCSGFLVSVICLVISVFPTIGSFFSSAWYMIDDVALAFVALLSYLIFSLFFLKSLRSWCYFLSWIYVWYKSLLRIDMAWVLVEFIIDD